MRRVHLLRVAAPPMAFAPLIAAASTSGLRIGWLELEQTVGVPRELEEAVEMGTLRAVAVGSGHSVAVKRIGGEPVLRDLLREHFLGCRLVLVRGVIDAPAIGPESGSWRLRDGAGRSVLRSTAELLAALGRRQLLSDPS